MEEGQDAASQQQARQNIAFQPTTSVSRTTTTTTETTENGTSATAAVPTESFSTAAGRDDAASVSPRHENAQLPPSQQQEAVPPIIRAQVIQGRGNRPRGEGRRDTGWIGADAVFDAIQQQQRQEEQQQVSKAEFPLAPSPSPLNPAATGDNSTSKPMTPSVRRAMLESNSGYKVSPDVRNVRPPLPSSVRSGTNLVKGPNVGPTGSVLERVRSAREADGDDFDEPVEQNKQNAHALSWEQVVELLDTNAITGLTSSEAQERLHEFGRNKLAEKKPEPFWHKVFRQINSVLIYILIAAAVIAGVFQEWAEMGLVLGVIAINVVIGLVQEGKAERATAALKAMLSSKATVIRDGLRMEIDATEVVPGDIVFIESGNKVPADLRMIAVNNLAIQEAMLTGESLSVNKKINKLAPKLGLGDRKNMAFSATSVVKGQGTGVVVATGDETEIGRINSSVNEVKEEKTRLIKQVDAFGYWIFAMIIPIAVASFLLAYFSPGEQNGDLSFAFIEMVAIAVAVVPEGLPAIITITLSIGTANMAKHHAIVKSLPSVETLGSVMVICSDKTGTLTKNEMTVVACRTTSSAYKVSMVGYDPTGGTVTPESPSAAVVDGGGDGKSLPQKPQQSQQPTQTESDGVPQQQQQQQQQQAQQASSRQDINNEDLSLVELARGGLLCNDSRIERSTLRDRPIVLPIGDPTEVALVTFAEKLGMDCTTERDKYKRIGVIPFESEHKFMCTFHDGFGSSVVVYIKGAPDRLIAKSQHEMMANGSLKEMEHENWQQHAAQLSSGGLRCLAVCRYEIDRDELESAIAQGPGFILNRNKPFLTFLGIQAIMDPPREECVTAIKEAHTAGITVKMITGDHPMTAKAIGQALGIVDSEHALVKTGPDLDALALPEMREIVMHCNVYARASPDNKISIIRALQAEKQVCSMTGDGVNDAPALRAADIGVAMGITGTDVSKDSAKMILTDDNFATILVAVKEGRRVWDNLRKLLVFNMPASFAQGGVVFFALALQWNNVPLTAIQILYVNMITACTLGLMLAVEPAESDIMQRPPRSPKARLIGAFFFWRTFFVAMVFIFFVLGAVAWLNTLYDSGEAPVKQQHAIALNTLVFCEITYAFNCRFLQKSSFHPRIFRGNNFAWGCALVMVGLQVLITYVPGLNDFFSMEGMTGPAWGITLLFAAASFIIVEIEKALQKPLRPYTHRCILSCQRCWWRCWCGCCPRFFVDRMNIEKQGEQQPKGQDKLPRRVRSGGSLRFVPGEQVTEPV